MTAPALALGEERQPDEPQQDVQSDGSEPTPRTERPADDQDPERLAGPGNRVERDGDRAVR